MKRLPLLALSLAIKSTIEMVMEQQAGSKHMVRGLHVAADDAVCEYFSVLLRCSANYRCLMWSPSRHRRLLAAAEAVSSPRPSFLRCSFREACLLARLQADADSAAPSSPFQQLLKAWLLGKLTTAQPPSYYLLSLLHEPYR